jgi:hypothetical protein
MGMRKAIIWIILSIVSVSCGGKSPIPGQESEKVFYITPAETETYSYEFTTKKCTTGSRNFSTFLAACDGLVDEAGNNECAFDEREDLFVVSECPGSF